VGTVHVTAVVGVAVVNVGAMVDEVAGDVVDGTGMVALGGGAVAGVLGELVGRD
jgi:hypothetical protein